MRRITVAAMAVLTASIAGAASNASLYDLRSEYLTNPMGIDTAKPRLSWKMKDATRGALQQAYQVQVASTTDTLLSGKADIWDSGRQETSSSVEIPYGGPALKPRTTYVWRVKAWDKDGQETAYSDPTVWETGLMSRDAWKGQWIAGQYKETEKQISTDKVTWIWYPEGEPSKKAPKGQRYFRYHFELPESPVESASAWVLVDNSADVYINGKKAQFSSGFKGITPVDVTKFFDKPGKVNVVQITANNSGNNPAGLAWCADLKFKDGSTRRLSTDISWRTSKEQGKDWPENPGKGQGEWIGAQDLGEIGMEPWGKPAIPVEGGPASLHRKNFETASQPESARLYITALGSYRAEINGQRVGDEILTPDWTDFRDRVMYQTYDVTSLVKSGKNAIGVTLGDGWYGSGLGWALERFTMGEPPTRFLAQLHLRYSDGREDVIATDSSWKTSESAIRRSEIYAGETYDARMEKDGWSQADFNDSDWAESLTPETSSSIVISAQASPPIRVDEELKPVAITEPTPGTYIYDMGQNMVGWVRLKVKGNAGDKVRMRFVEILNPDGTVYTENLRRAEATDTYTLKGGEEEVFEPHFTYHGFRYVEVTGYPGGKPGMDAILGRVFYTDAPFIGQFESSDAMVNKIRANTMWGLKGNLMSVPTDCPQRDERLGWTGDAQAIWKTACYNLDMASFSEKWLRDMRDAQGEEGDYSNVAPRIISTETAAPAWGDAGVICTYQAWQMYGDTKLVSDMWESMEGWLNFIGKANPNFIWENRRGNDYGDWVPANSTTDKTLIATAYWAGDALKMRDMAAALGKADKVREYDELYANIKKAFQKRFIQPDGKIANGSQTCYILALENGLVQDDLVEKAVTHLVDDITSRGNHLSTGFLGSTYLMPMLTEHGKLDVAYTLLLNKTFPSWGYMVEKGATTIWERWNSDTGDPAMNSFNHYTYGAVTDWMFGYVGGIRPAVPGYKEILIEPNPDSRLTYANTSYDSTYGEIKTSWKYEGENWKLDVTIPANTTARISLPTADAAKVTEGGKTVTEASLAPTIEDGRTVINTGSGSYSFVVSK